MAAADPANSMEALARVRALLPSLKPSEARVARVVLDDPVAVIYRSVSEVAEAAGSSTATVVRCAQRLGFKGFHDLKLALARGQAPVDPPATRLQTEGPVGALTQVIEAGSEAVRDASVLIVPPVFEAAVRAINGAERVLFLAVGTSAPLAQDAAYRFRAIGLLADAPADLHIQHVAARLLRPGDVCLAISHSGSTRETLAAVQYAKDAGATTVGITSYLHSPLTELAQLVLVAGTREISFRLEAVASRLAHMVVIDALLVAVADLDPARSQRALDLYADVLSDHRS